MKREHDLLDAARNGNIVKLKTCANEAIESEKNLGLAHACKAGKIYACILLLQTGANPHVTIMREKTALQWAVAMNHLKIIQFLLQWAPPSSSSLDVMLSDATRINRPCIVSVLSWPFSQQRYYYSLDKPIGAGVLKPHLVRMGWIYDTESKCYTEVAFKLFSAADSQRMNIECELSAIRRFSVGGLCCSMVSEELFRYSASSTMPCREDPQWLGLALEKGQADLHMLLFGDNAATHLLDLAARMSLALQVARIVEHLHRAHNVAWLDVKLQNFICFRGENGAVTLKATDLSGCLPLGSTVSIKNVTFTSKFASPELATAAIHASADTINVSTKLDYWALGLCLVCILDSSGTFFTRLEQRLGLHHSEDYLKLYARTDAEKLQSDLGMVVLDKSLLGDSSACISSIIEHVYGSLLQVDADCRCGGAKGLDDLCAVIEGLYDVR